MDKVNLLSSVSRILANDSSECLHLEHKLLSFRDASSTGNCFNVKIHCQDT